MRRVSENVRRMPPLDQSNAASIILGSRSPQRLQLLGQLVTPERIHVLPPLDDQEEGFDGLSELPEIIDRLASIARTKAADVQRQSEKIPDCNWSMIICADTVILGREDNGQLTALGKPDGLGWEDRVRDWFTRYYSARTHHVASAVCVIARNGEWSERTHLTDVRFHAVESGLLDWYIATKEPLGKAGGYGLQGAGGMFLESIHGSISNVIGLPLEACWDLGVGK